MFIRHSFLGGRRLAAEWNSTLSGGVPKASNSIRPLNEVHLLILPMRSVFIAMILIGFCQDGQAESTGAVYRQAVVAFDSQDWGEAAAGFKQVYQRDPTSPEAEDSLFFWGESLLQSGRFEDARQRFDDYLRQWPKGRRVRAAQFRVAEAMMLGRNYEKAKYRINRFIALYPSDPLLEYANAYLAEIAIAENDLTEAERLFTDVIQKYPKGRLAAESRLGLEKLGKTKELPAENASKSLARSPATGSSRIPSQATRLTANATEPITNTRHVSASDIVIEEKQPESTAAVMLRKALFFEHSGKLDPALVAYKDLYRQLPHTSEADQARLAAARIYTQLQQPRQAKAIYDELLIRAGKAGSSLDLASILFEASQAQEVIEREEGQALHVERKSMVLLKRLLREFPEKPESARAAYRLARCAMDAEDFDAACEYLKKSLASEDALIVGRSLQLSWRIAAVEQDWVAVRRAAERFLTLDEKEVPSELGLAARFWIAEADYRTGQFKSARHRFDALVKRVDGRDFPWTGLVALRLAQSLAQLGDFAGARRVAEKSSAAFPDFAERYEFDYLIGQCAFVQGEYNVARAAYDRVTQASTAGAETSLLAIEAIASTYFVQEDYESAAAEFAKLQVDGVPSSCRAKSLHYTAFCYERLGKKGQAETIYQRLVDRYPGYSLR